MKPAHVSGATAAAFAVAVLAVPAAEALSRQRTAHRPTAKSTRTELHAARATLARAASELTGIRREIRGGRLGREMSRLQRTVNKAKAQLASAEATVPTPLALAVKQVRREVAYVKGGVSYSHGQLVSQAAMDYVTGHVSDTAFGYLKLSGGRLPKNRPNPALAAQAGVCSHAAVTFAAIVEALGLRVRSVNFNYVDPGPNPTSDGHVAVEVFYDGGWHFFDPTFGAFWTTRGGSVISISEVRAGLGTLQKDVAAFTNVFEDAVLGDDMWFVTDPTATVLIGATELTGKWH